MTTVLGILAGVLILGLIMVLHELGHFLTGRMFGFKIDQFSIFMGPVLWEREKDGIRYNIKAIPLGASVSFAGEASEIEGQADDSEIDPDDPSLFENKPKWQRAIVIAAGPLMNFLTAFIVFIIMFAAQGAVVPDIGDIPEGSLIAESRMEVGDTIRRINGTRIATTMDVAITEMSHKPGAAWRVEYETKNGAIRTETLTPDELKPRPMLGISYTTTDDVYEIVQVHPDADRGPEGYMVGDRLISLDGITFDEGERITEAVTASAGAPMRAVVERNGHVVELDVEPVMLAVEQPLGLVMTLSDRAGDVISQGVRYPWSIIRTTVRGLGMLFAGELKFRDSFAGPIAIVSMATTSVTQGGTFGQIMERLGSLLGLLSVAVGFTNLIPIPPLDGNHLLLLGVEAIRRKPLSERFKTVTGMIGLGFFLILGISVIVLDILRLLGR